MKYKIVEVTWVDAEEHGEIGWNNLKAQLKYAKKPPPLMKSVGYEVHRCSEHISLLSSVGDKECSSLEKIPAEFIKSVVTLTVDKVSK